MPPFSCGHSGTILVETFFFAKWFASEERRGVLVPRVKQGTMKEAEHSLQIITKIEKLK